MSAPINRDAVRSALSVFLCAALREELGPEEAMASAIQTYLNQETREAGQDPRFYRPGRPAARGLSPAVYVLIWLVGVVLILSGCGRSIVEPTATEIEARVSPCQVETLACYHFEGSLLVRGRTLDVEGWSQDMPRPGYANHWRYVLSPRSSSLLARYARPTSSWLGGAAVVWPSGRGGMYQEALESPGGALYWRLDMRPTDAGVAEKFAALAGSREYRAQTFSVRRDGSWVELLIEEPVR